MYEIVKVGIDISVDFIVLLNYTLFVVDIELSQYTRHLFKQLCIKIHLEFTSTSVLNLEYTYRDVMVNQ